MMDFFLKKWTKPGLFCLFLFFSHDKYSTNNINEKSVDGVLGTRTRGSRMVGADESTELWWHPYMMDLELQTNNFDRNFPLLPNPYLIFFIEYLIDQKTQLGRTFYKLS